jgi:hypothetical protein
MVGTGASDDAKAIPQNGYSIFKVRATRTPVANSAGIMVTPSSGDEINILLGQNKLQYDGTLSFEPFLTSQVQLGAGDTDTGAGDDSQGAGGSAELFTITIPANARDSGDVVVFIPVLGGNELVWQCDETVIVEAWANWQPIFHFECYGRFAFPYRHNDPEHDYQYMSPYPTAWPRCLSFANYFETYIANYGNFDSMEGRTQFPISAEIVNDLEACLNLI